MKYKAIRPEFVEFIPEELEQGVLYISFRYATATHLCPCGCGHEIVTPFSPINWKLIFDGEVSVRPSVGNWSLPCHSHYFISHGRIEEAGLWSDERVAQARDKEADERKAYFARPTPDPAGRESKRRRGWFGRLWQSLGSLLV